jgi:hypothetical protein
MGVINNLKGCKKESKEFNIKRIESIDYLEEISAEVDLINEPLNPYLQPNIEKGVI